MKIIQSFWSKPSFDNFQDFQNSRRFSGWLNFKYFLMGSALSCLTIKKQQGNIHLYTDNRGKKIFIDQLGLPYDDASLALNALENEDHRLWILGKLMAIRAQDQPFIHIDNDIFLWENLPNSDRSDFLIAQSETTIWQEYISSLNEIFANFSFVPDCMQERPTPMTMVTNVGVIGGNDIKFFQNFCELSKRLLETNRDKLHLVEIGGFNQMLEEYLFTSLARHNGRQIQYVLGEPIQGLPSSCLGFNIAPSVYKYVHLIGNNKSNPLSCEQIELRLKHEFPEYHRRVIEVISDISQDETTRDVSKRQERIERSVNLLYKHSFQEIKQMKIQIVPGIEFSPVQSYVKSDVDWAITERSPDGNLTIKSLPPYAATGAKVWTPFFKRPATILDMMQEVDVNYNDTEDLQSLKVDIIDAVMQNLTVLGTLEVVE